MVHGGRPLADGPGGGVPSGRPKQMAPSGQPPADGPADGLADGLVDGRGSGRPQGSADARRVRVRIRRTSGRVTTLFFGSTSNFSLSL
jgi:hypothetical protein